MTDFIDILSHNVYEQEAIDINEDMLSAEDESKAMQLLMANKDYVIMVMNIRHSGIFNEAECIKCILKLMKDSQGIVDIKNAIWLTVLNIENYDFFMPQIEQMIKTLRLRFPNEA